jgi:salicylate biosynthesis isochorismate synthase/menaquinone-specific isochorismate synthase
MRFALAARAVPSADPLAFFAASCESARFFWSRDDFAVAASGACATIETRGMARFAEAARASVALARDVEGANEVAAPLFVGGFAFDETEANTESWRGFPALRFWLPRRLLVRRGSDTTLVAIEPRDEHASTRMVRAALEASLARESHLLSVAEPPRAVAGEPAAYRIEADRPHTAYRALVAAARDAVAAGACEKLVVARSIHVRSAEQIDAAALLAALRRAHPHAASFAVASGARCFLGATPERLAEVEGRQVATAAPNPRAPRGRAPDEDAALGRALRESKKEQEEHAIVVRAVAAALAPLCDRLAVPESPRLLALEGIQHLETPIEGTLRAPRHLLDVAARLHPTPAVAGAPRAAALDWLAAHESLDRGWYAGGVGFVDAKGGGELAVALRCALLDGGDATGFAGAGVVAASDPHAELVETRLKLRALLAPLLEL